MKWYHKITAGLVVPLLVITLGLAYPRPAHAIPVAVIANIVQIPYDSAILIEDTITAISEVIKEVKELGLDKVAWITSKVQLAEEASKIVSQVQSGRDETGLGLFVQDWQLVGDLQRKKAANSFIKELSSSQIDPAFKGTLLRSFKTNPYEDRSVFSRLRPTFKEDVASYPGCESGECDTKSFLNDFSKGGWLGFQSLTNNPAHNPFTSYNLLLQDKTEKEERAKQAALDEARASQGFLGTQDCPEEPQPDDFVGPPEPQTEEGITEESIISGATAALKTARCKITRPGSSVGQDLAQAFGGLHETLASSDELWELIAGGLQSLVGNTRSRGLKSKAALQEARVAITEEDRGAAIEEEERIIAKAQTVLSSVYTIWKLKEKNLNANTELKAILEKIIANRALCNTPKTEDIPDNAEIGLFDVENRERDLSIEVGVGNTVGTFAVGGAHSLNLAEKLADAQFLIAIIKDPSTLPPNNQVSKKLRDVFNALPPNDTEGRLQEARQRLGGAVAELEIAMIPFDGAAQQANGFLRSIQSQIKQAKIDQKACKIP